MCLLRLVLWLVQTDGRYASVLGLVLLTRSVAIRSWPNGCVAERCELCCCVGGMLRC